MKALEAQLEKDPHDAAAFLVYADALLEQGEPLGELIRVQHALAQQPPDAALDARDLALRTRLLPALARHGTKWSLGFPRFVDVQWVADEALSELVEALGSPLCRFIETVRLSDFLLPDDLDALARGLVTLPRFEALTLSNNLEVLRGGAALLRELQGLARYLGPKLRRLTLEVRNPREVMSVLPALPELRQLTLDGARLEPDDAQALKLARLVVGRDCELRLERGSCSFAAEAAIGGQWPIALSVAGPGLLVEAPALHRGRYLQSGKQLRIGAHFACELSIEGCSLGQVHSVFDANTLRPAGDLSVRPRVLSDGQAVRLGDVAFRFCADLAAARAALRVG